MENLLWFAASKCGGTVLLMGKLDKKDNLVAWSLIKCWGKRSVQEEYSLEPFMVQVFYKN